ncbi:SHOCT domain-containing protein [Hymenobacter volaticus]|uniref:SHOCT domain-containing protein n=1 Tax=Hymenobacter volaticus TaxID=2932254 RepID=A0ABY4G476_9BACT|nr:SHOCT domain-containing protein [Hymenobacter volaticus]UOQ65585.1 SHOCT domain-containing protein [Hymenobacter volaticus]
MDKSSSPLDTLRQLRELLDAGTITPQEFETLKARLLADQLAAPAVPPSAPPTVPLNPTFTAPATTGSSVEPVRSEPVPVPPIAPAPVPTPVEELPPLLDFFKQPQTPGTSPPPPPAAPVREEKPAPYAAPYTPPTPPAPAAPTAAPESFPPGLIRRLHRHLQERRRSFSRPLLLQRRHLRPHHPIFPRQEPNQRFRWNLSCARRHLLCRP